MLLISLLGTSMMGNITLWIISVTKLEQIKKKKAYRILSKLKAPKISNPNQVSKNIAEETEQAMDKEELEDHQQYKDLLKRVALLISVLNLVISLIVWILFNHTSKYFQFIQEHYNIGYYDFYLGVDGLSIYFVLLTTIIIPISIVSNWKSIDDKVVYFLTVMLLLETLLLLIYMVLDLLMFYIFFESILAPLFILIGIFGSIEKQRASFYFFLYTFLGSLFMLLSIITISYLSGCTDINIVSRNGFVYITQLLIFIGIFIAFAVKTPVIYLNGWLLKAHVESPLSGSIILAAIVLKLSLYGIFRLILIISPKAYLACTYVIFTIGVITIVYASLSTLRTIDIKELIAYSSVSHAAVYFIGVFSNVIQGIIGAICLGLAHGFVSSGLFTIVGGVLYDRSGTRLISYYKGLVQAMPILSILFFILSLGNCGAPLTLNFIGEFMSLYGVFERLPIAGILASSSIVFSAAFTIFMFNRIMFGGSLLRNAWIEYLMDLNVREYSMLLVLVVFTVFLGIYPSIITDGLNYVSTGLLYSFKETMPVNFEINLVIPFFYTKFFKNTTKKLNNPSILINFLLLLCYVSSILLCYVFKKFSEIEMFPDCNESIIICVIIHLVVFLLLHKSSYVLKVKNFDWRVNIIYLIISYIAITFLICAFMHVFKHDPATQNKLLIFFFVDICITSVIHSIYVREKTSKNLFIVMYHKYRTGELKQYIGKILKYFILLIFISILILIFMNKFNMTESQIGTIMGKLAILQCILFLVKYLTSKKSGPEALLDAWKDVLKIYSAPNILIAILVISVFYTVKLCFFFWFFEPYIKTLKSEIIIYYLKFNVNSLNKFYLENINNIKRLNFIKVDFSNLFMSITVSKTVFAWNTGTPILVLNYFERDGYNVNENNARVVIDAPFEEEGSPNPTETSLDIVNQNRSTYSRQFLKEKLNSLFDRRRNLTLSYNPYTHANYNLEAVTSLVEEENFWFGHVVRNYEHRDTRMGFKVYQVLFRNACNVTNSGIDQYRSYKAKYTLCTDPSLAINIENLKYTAHNETKRLAIYEGSRILHELRQLRDTIPIENRDIWTVDVRNAINDPRGDWTIGNTLPQQRLDYINATQHGRTLEFTIQRELPPVQSLDRNRNLLFHNRHFSKYKYNHRSYEKYWYDVTDTYNVAKRPFEPLNPFNSDLATNILKVLEDSYNNRLTSVNGIMHSSFQNWFVKAIEYGINNKYDPRDSANILREVRRHPAVLISPETFDLLKNWMGRERISLRTRP